MKTNKFGRVSWALVASSIFWVLGADSAWAQKRTYRQPARMESSQEGSDSKFTWDIGGSTGSYNGLSYTEINLGLNWSFSDYLVWRNALFSRVRQGSETVNGLDSSLRLQYTLASEDGGVALSLFGGPGYRVATRDASAAFVEAGAEGKLGGLRVGASAKMIFLPNPGTDVNGDSLPKQDIVYTITLSGNGAF